jgi:3-oxosteroid 1-dehydrogenase
VIGPDDRPVAGLYALGNAAAQPTGNAYPTGGMTFGPIITFAWLAALALTAEVERGRSSAAA